MLNLTSTVREPESLATIRFQDCDPFGHLNNARYVDYFFNARQDQLVEHYNLSTYEPDSPAKASWVVSRTQIAYLRPAQVMEQVLIRTRLIHFSDTTLVVEGLMLDREGKQLKAFSWVEFVYVSLATGRPTSHPEELLALCRTIVVDVNYAADGFNARVENAAGQYRQRIPKAASAELVPAAV